MVKLKQAPLYLLTTLAFYTLIGLALIMALLSTPPG